MASIFRTLLGSDDTGGSWVQSDSILSAKILGYMGRIIDRALVQRVITQRYGTRINQVKDSVSGITYESFADKSFAARMAANQIETVCVGYGHKVAAAIATLFSESSQSFTLVGPTEETDTSAASEVLTSLRGGDPFIEALVQADYESIWLGTSVIFAEFVDRALRYHVIDPGKVQVCFDEWVVSDGRNRPANRLDLEDATCVVVETGSPDDQTHSYVAIFGRSEDLPKGRYVRFKSSGNGREIPRFGADDSSDWVQDGQPANPMSWYAEEHPDEEVPEFPLVLIRSGLVREDRLIPLSEGLLQESLEADVAATHIRATSGDNAKGTRVFTKSDAGGHQVIPRAVRGDVSLEVGQTLDEIHGDINAPRIAWDLLKEEMTSAGQGWCVPDFHLRSEDYTVEASSGVALKQRSRQLFKLRERRKAKNAPAVRRLFQIEKALISIFADGEDSAILLLEQCDQMWDPGEQDIPVDPAIVTSEIQRCLDLGLYDAIEAIRVKYDLSSEAEAIDKYELLAARAKKYPPLSMWGDEDSDEDADEGSKSKKGGWN